MGNGMFVERSIFGWKPWKASGILNLVLPFFCDDLVLQALGVYIRVLHCGFHSSQQWKKVSFFPCGSADVIFVTGCVWVMNSFQPIWVPSNYTRCCLAVCASIVMIPFHVVCSREWHANVCVQVYLLQLHLWRCNLLQFYLPCKWGCMYRGMKSNLHK